MTHLGRRLCIAALKVAAVEHHAALPYAELPALLIELRAQEGTAARGLEFLILCAGRTGEVIGARWHEIDLLDKTWTVPAARMKAGKEHRVSLAPRASAILDEMAKHRPAGDDGAGYVFGGAKAGKPLSNMALLMLLRRMKRDDLTAHGFRSTFRTWAAERTNFPREVIEAALAHTIGNKVEAAYQRGDLFEKRRRLMEAWAQFCASGTAAGQVIPMQGKRAAG
jgi:integrase